MFTALVYILSAATLACIIYFARSSGHEVDNDGEIFGYQKNLLRILLAFVPVPTILMALVYAVTKPRMTNASLCLLIIIGISWSLAFAYGYSYLNRFKVKLMNDKIIIINNKTIKLSFDDIKEIHLLESGNNMRMIKIFTNKKKCVSLSSTLSDFDQMVELVKLNSSKYGVNFRFRDKWGRWSN